jgi:hypothetical protein
MPNNHYFCHAAIQLSSRLTCADVRKGKKQAGISRQEDWCLSALPTPRF